MPRNLKRLLVILWMLLAAFLVFYVGHEQASFKGTDLGQASKVDTRAIQHQNHVLLSKPWVLIPYLVLVASSLAFLLGPGRNEYHPRIRTYFLSAISVSVVVYLYLLLLVK